MYKIIVPLSSGTLTRENREDYLSLMKECGAKRVLIGHGCRFLGEMSEGEFELLCENIRYFTDNGIEVFVWQGLTIGHGIPLTHDGTTHAKTEYTQLVTSNGTVLDGAFCPMDSEFRGAVTAWIKKLATCGVGTIILDDDFRMSQRNDGAFGIACCCDKHLAYMSERCGCEVTLSDIERHVLHGEPNKFRDAWLSAQREGLVRFVSELRAAVDEVNPDVRLALCSAWCNWNIDGVDALELTKILAGKNKPVLRLHGAPYWQKCGAYNSSVISASELSRMLASFCEGEEVEIFSEGDVYPRPRYNIPAAHLEVFDAAQRAQGEIGGILKYVFDYVADEGYEMGYVRAHTKDLPLFEKISDAFSDGDSVGVRIYEYPHLLRGASIPENSSANLSITPNVSGALFAENGIPTVYSGEGIAPAVFGEAARSIPLTEIKRGAIIDSDAARILTERGIDVGIKRFISDERYAFTREECFGKQIPVNGDCRLLVCDYDDGIIPVSYTEANGKRIITSYRYTSAAAEKFFVLAFPIAEIHGDMRVNYERQAALRLAVEWIGGAKLPVFLKKCPYLYSIIKKKCDKTLAVLINCYEDEIISPTIELDREYSKVNFIFGDGHLEGSALVLDEDISAYKLTAFELIP